MTQAAAGGDRLDAPHDEAPCARASTLPGGELVRANLSLARWTGRSPAALLGTRLPTLQTAAGAARSRSCRRCRRT